MSKDKQENQELVSEKNIKEMTSGKINQEKGEKMEIYEL